MIAPIDLRLDLIDELLAARRISTVEAEVLRVAISRSQVEAVTLVQARADKGWSQRELAEAVGAHWITISKLERGKMRLTFEWADRIARALDRSVWTFFVQPPASEAAP